jgi:hypothetical protein
MKKSKSQPFQSSDIALRPTTEQDVALNDMNSKSKAKNNRFLPNFKEINEDIHKIVQKFDSFATRKTIATGFFNIALIATNISQIKQICAPAGGRTPVWNAINIILLVFASLSLLLQFFLATILAFLAKQGEFIDETKRNQLIRSNNGATILCLVITVINIFINVFLSV